MKFIKTFLMCEPSIHFTEDKGSEPEEDDEEDDSDKPVLKTAEIYHAGPVNRVRVSQKIRFRILQKVKMIDNFLRYLNKSGIILGILPTKDHNIIHSQFC